MEEVKLLDAGPIVALMDQREQHHPWARETFARLALPLITCRAALTEASHLLRDEPSALARLMRHVDRAPCRMRNLGRQTFLSN